MSVPILCLPAKGGPSCTGTWASQDRRALPVPFGSKCYLNLGDWLLEQVFLEDLGGTSNCDFRHAREVEIGQALLWTPLRYALPGDEGRSLHKQGTLAAGP